MADINTQDEYQARIPEWVESEAHLKELEHILDALRESGTVNMFQAAGPLQQACRDWMDTWPKAQKAPIPELTDDQAKEMLVFWMNSYSFRADSSIMPDSKSQKETEETVAAAVCQPEVLDDAVTLRGISNSINTLLPYLTEDWLSRLDTIPKTLLDIADRMEGKVED
mgnify:CR=1 FL=1|tara:strand:- start:18 stop:521 length:504 start_codon:yes stop_codon:yes gene_type:complete